MVAVPFGLQKKAMDWRAGVIAAPSLIRGATTLCKVLIESTLVSALTALVIICAPAERVVRPTSKQVADVNDNGVRL